MIKQFRFSIVMAIYNMEQYLEESINSILHQTIGFEDNLQILFVNDGSTDQSKLICKKYEEMYPENIIYIEKENGGVSEARNRGLEYAKGELVNFLDADDKLELDALHKVYGFYVEHKDEIDLISIPLYFFEGKEGAHVLNDKFFRTRVVDIKKEPKCFQMHISSSFINLDTMKNYSFNSNLKFGEDAEVANKIIISKGKYGVIADTKYWYRQRSAGNSAIQGAKVNKENYIPPLKYLHLELIRFSQNRYHEVLEYLQWMLIYDLGWKIRVPYLEETVLNENEIVEFLDYVKQVLRHVKDEIILSNSYLKRSYYMYLLKLKHGELTKENLRMIGNREEVVVCKENFVIDILSLQTVFVDNIDIVDNVMYLDASFCMTFELYDFTMIADQNGNEVMVPYVMKEEARIYSLNQKVNEGYGFKLEVPITSSNTLVQMKAVLGESKVILKLVLQKEDEIISKMGTKGFQIKCKERMLGIEKHSDAIDKNSEIKCNKPHKMSKSALLLIEYYANCKGWNRVLLNLMGKSQLAKLNQITENIEEIELVSIPDKVIPFSYRYCLLKNIKNHGDYNLDVATIYNQAFWYSKEGIIVRKATDMVVKIDNIACEGNQIVLKGGMEFPFLIDNYSLNCICNKQRYLCNLTKSKDKSEKWFGYHVMEYYEFHIDAALQTDNEVVFELNIRSANVILRLKMDETKLKTAALRADLEGQIVDKKRILLHSK